MDEQEGTPSELDLRDYLRVLRRRKGLIALAVILFGCAAFFYASVQTPIYQASAKVLLQPRSTDSLFDPQTGQRNDAARQVETEIQVVRSEPVQAAVREELGSSPSIGANPVGNTDVILLTAQSTDPKRAAAVANAYAKAYVDYRRKQAVDDLLAAGQEIQHKVTDLQRQIDDIDRQINTAPALAQEGVRENLEPKKVALIDQQALFKQRLDQLQVETALTTGRAQVVAPASVPGTPVKPRPVRTAVLGVIVGLVLGVGLAFVLEHLDDTVKTTDALARITHVPVAGVIPMVTTWKAKNETRVVSVTDPRSPATEAYRSLRTSIHFLSLERPVRTIQVTSPAAEEGKTTTIANLGVALANAGQRVILACCDLRRPRIHEFFGLTNSVGLTSMLLGEAPVSAALQPVPGQDRLSVVASGPLPPNPSELLSSPRIVDVLTTLLARADVVLLDSPPVLPVTDSLVLSGRVDATLLVCYAGSTTEKQLARATQLLRQVDAPLVGTVLSGVSTEDSYGYAYQYYRYERPETEAERVNGERKWLRRRPKVGASTGDRAGSGGA